LKSCGLSPRRGREKDGGSFFVGGRKSFLSEKKGKKVEGERKSDHVFCQEGRMPFFRIQKGEQFLEKVLCPISEETKVEEVGLLSGNSGKKKKESKPISSLISTLSILR